jgi:hypothetical protein
MSKTFFTTELRTRLGTLTLKMIDDRDAPTSVEFSYPVEDPVEIRWGESRSAGFGDAVVGSFADLVVPDPEGYFQDFFGTQFDEINWKVLIEGTLDGREFLWKGRVQQSQFDEPVSPRVQVDRKRIRVYDRIGALGDKQPISRPESMDVEEILMRTLFSAQPDVDIVYKIDAEGSSYFSGRDVPPREWFPTSRSPSRRRVGDTEDEDDEGLPGESLRAQLDTLAERLGLKVWYEPFTGMYHVVHRTLIGERIDDATRITGNGFPLDPQASPTFDRSYQIDSLMTTSPRLRAEGDDAYETVEGVRSVTVDIEDAPLVKDPGFRIYEYTKPESEVSDVEDFTADFLFWSHETNPSLVQKIDVIYEVGKTEWLKQGIVNSFVGLALTNTGGNYYSDQAASIRQQTRPIPEQDIPIKGVLEYQAVPRDGVTQNGEQYVFRAELEYNRDNGTKERVQTSEITAVDYSGQDGDPPVPSPKFIETSPTRLGGQFRISVTGNEVFFRVVDFKIIVTNPSGDNLVISSIGIQPGKDPSGRKEVSINDDTFYFNDPLLRLDGVPNYPRRDPQRPYHFRKAALETPQPINWSSARYGRGYNYLYEYRAADRLAQQPPGMSALSTKVVPGVLTPGRAIDMGTDGRLIFAGGRTVQLTGDEEATTELNDIFIPDVITDPVNPNQRPYAPEIDLDSFASYEVTAQGEGGGDRYGNIEGYRLYRRNAPGAPNTEVVEETTSQRTRVISAPNPRPVLNLHVATAFNSNGESPKSEAVLQTPEGWYTDGDTKLSPDPMPNPSAAASTGVLVDGELYLFGGIDGSGRHARCYKYDVWADTWTQLPDYPAGATEGLFAAPSQANDAVVVGGGIGPGGARSATYLWRRSSSDWKEIDDLEEPVGYAAAAQGVVGQNNLETLIVQGGEDGSGTATDAVQRLTTGFGAELRAWETLADTPFVERRHSAIFRSRDALWHFFGGAEDRFRHWTFDGSTDRWSPANAPSLPQPVSDYGIAYSRVRDSVILVGGTDDNGNVVGQPQEYSFQSGSWTELPAMPTPRTQARGALVDGFGILLAVGGEDGSPSGITEVRVL